MVLKKKQKIGKKKKETEKRILQKNKTRTER